MLTPDERIPVARELLATDRQIAEYQHKRRELADEMRRLAAKIQTLRDERRTVGDALREAVSKQGRLLRQLFPYR